MIYKKLIFEGELTTLNPYVDATRASRYSGANIKDTETSRIAWNSRNNQNTGTPVDMKDYPCFFHFTWFMSNRKKDPDNISFACKFIFDGLVKAGVIPGDGWKYVGAISHSFEVDQKNPRVVLVITSMY